MRKNTGRNARSEGRVREAEEELRHYCRTLYEQLPPEPKFMAEDEEETKRYLFALVGLGLSLLDKAFRAWLA